ncbi:hypothetical protein ACFYXF_12115 [Streptomyces sp. NPDC002680]|uniref:hypothetical protein n=1 Tax=Streptomyces sp. NPDC002680 TaxID=3364659 RepID=UPI0036BDE059
MAEDEDDDEERRDMKWPRARTSWHEVPLAFVAFMLLGSAVLRFVFALIALCFGFSVEKPADALLDLVGGVLFSCGLLWIFARFRSRGREKSKGKEF